MAQGYGGGQAPLPAHLNPRGRQRTGAGRRSAYRVLIAVMAVVSVFAFVVSAYAWWQFRDLNSGLQRGNFNTRALGSNKHDIDGQDQNLLIVGYDSREGLTKAEIKKLHVGSDTSSSTDTMLIVHVPADGSKATLISVPRDSYVAIPGHGMNKLNSAWADGYYGVGSNASSTARKVAGASLLTETISNLTGLTIDHFVLVSFGGFVRISDAVGGVTVDLCKAVDDSQYSGFVSAAGRHSISGAQALQFVRQRHNLPNGDLDRAARQRYFLTQAFRAITSTGTLFNPSRLNALVKAVDASIWVDKSLDLKSLALQMTKLDPANIISKAIPFERFENVDVGSVEIVDPAKVKAFVDKVVNPPARSKQKQSTGSSSGTRKKHARKKSCIN